MNSHSMSRKPLGSLVKLAYSASGKVSAACLDVLETESADVNNPLFKFDNVIVTPHSAWYSEESVNILLNSIADEAIRAIRGEAHRHVVNGIR